MGLENQKPADKIDQVDRENEIGENLYFEVDDSTPSLESSEDSSDNSNSADDSSSGSDSIGIPEDIAETLEPTRIEDINRQSQNIEDASSNPRQLESSIEQGMASLNINYGKLADAPDTRTASLESASAGSVKTTINESGVGVVETGDGEYPIDLSTADKVFQSTRSSSEKSSSNIEVARLNGDGQNFTNMTLMANSTQRIELPNGDVLHRPPKNEADVKWIKDVGGEKGNHSVIAYEDGRREIRYTKPQEDGIASVSFDKDGKVTGVRRAEREGGTGSDSSEEQTQAGDRVEPTSDSREEAGSSFESFQTSTGEVSQTYNEDSGEIVTRFPEDFGVNKDTGKFDNELAPELENVESITYDPKNAEEPYAVQMKEGKGSPEEKAKLLEKLKNGEVSIPLSFHPDSENPESINFFAGKFNSSDPADRRSGAVTLKPDGTLELTHGENTDGKVKTIKYPPNYPEPVLERTEYDSEVTASLPDNHPSKNLEYTERYIDDEGKERELRKLTTDARTDTGDAGDGENDTRDNPDESSQEVQDPLEIAGSSEDFEYGSEKGTLYTDDKTGYVSGIKFTEGSRAGQEYQFAHDESGNLTEMTVRVPQEGGEPKEVKFKRDGENWKVEPKDSQIPGFENMQIDENGVITGNIKVKENGDIVYDAGDGTMEAMRANGTHDKYNLNDYHRERTTVDGTTKSEYWDGYDWREGDLQKNEDGTSTITFKGEGKVSKIIRDSRDQEGGEKNDRVIVVRSDGTVFDANWKGNKMSRTRGQNTATLYNSGIVDANGKRVWLEGREVQGGVLFNDTDPAVKAQMESGKLPKFAEHHDNGDVTSLYLDGRRIRSDKEGRVNQLDHVNGQHVKMERDAYGRVMRVEGIDGKTLVRDENLKPDENGNQFTRWKVEGGQADETYEGRLEIGADNSVKLTGRDNLSTTIEANGRTTNRTGAEITGVLDSFGQKWFREKREGESVEGNEPWTVVSKDGTRHTFEAGGELTLLDSGKAGIKYDDGSIKSLDGKGTLSTYNKDGVEVLAVNKDGSKVVRDDQGYLQEIHTRVDGESNDTEESKRKYDVRSFVHKDGKLIGVNLNGEPSEVFVDGRFRQLKNNKNFSDTSQENLGDYVDYDKENGNRTVRTPENKDSAARTVHELSGTRKTFDANNQVTDARVIDRASGTIFEIENKLLESIEDGKSGIKRSFRYPENTGETTGREVPSEIYQSTNGGEEVLVARLAQPEDGAPGEFPFEMFPGDNNDGAKKIFGRLDRRTGDLMYFNRDQQTGDISGVWTDRLNGSSSLDFRGQTIMTKQNDQIQTAQGMDGTERKFEYKDGALLQVTTTGEPPVVTDRIVDGKLMAVDKEDPDKILGPSSYDAKTGIYRIDYQDENGRVTHSTERHPDGSEINYDAEGRRTSAELEGVWKDSYENGVRRKRELADGNTIEYNEAGEMALYRVKGQFTDSIENGRRVRRQFDSGASMEFDPQSGRMTKSVDSNGIERTFVYRNQYEGELPDSASGNNSANDIVEVRARNTHEEGSEYQVVEKIGQDGRLHPVEEGKESEVVFYHNSQRPEGGTRDVIHTFTEGEDGKPTPATATRYMLNGSKYRQAEGEGLKLVEFGAEQQTDATSGAHVDSIESLESVGPLAQIQERDYAKVGELSDEIKGTAQPESEVSLEHQKRAMLAHAENLPAKEKVRLLRDLENFENRARDVGLSRDEVAKTLYFANKLMETGNPKSPLSQADLVRTSLALMHGAADPEISNHGVHNTCGTTTVRESMLSTNPSRAGRIASAAMLDGEMTVGQDGEIKPVGATRSEGDTRVVFDLASMKADNEAILSAASSIKSDATGYRDQLGQALDHALVNYAHISSWNQRNPGQQLENAVYTQTSTPGEADTGERLNLPGLDESRNASLSFRMLADINKSLLGQERLAVNSTVEKDSGVEAQFSTASELSQVLNSGLADGPMTLLVNGSHPAFGEHSEEGDDWDLVNVSESKNIDGKQYFKISGFHGSKSDKWISESDLYNATLESTEHNARALDDIDVDMLAQFNSIMDDEDYDFGIFDIYDFDSADDMLASIGSSPLLSNGSGFIDFNDFHNQFDTLRSDAGLELMTA